MRVYEEFEIEFRNLFQDIVVADFVGESSVHLRHHVVGVLEKFTRVYNGTSVPVCC